VQISQTLKEDRGRRDSGGDNFLSDLQDDGGSGGGILHSGLQDDSGNGCRDDEGGRRRADTLTRRGDNGPGRRRASTPVRHRVGGSGRRRCGAAATGASASNKQRPTSRRRGGAVTSNGWRCYNLPRTAAARGRGRRRFSLHGRRQHGDEDDDASASMDRGGARMRMTATLHGGTVEGTMWQFEMFT
jgi:hypothetical protein